MKEQTTVSEVIRFFEMIAPAGLQESYDNSGLQTGDPSQAVMAALVSVDVTEEILDEAIRTGANLIVVHHPVIFNGLKKITGSTPVEKILLKAIRNHIAILAVHTNLDNIQGGVNTKIANKLGLVDCRILQPLKGSLRKLVTFIPVDYFEPVSQAIFDAGAGHIGNYSHCGYHLGGIGTFLGDKETRPFTGEPGKLHREAEIRFETIFPTWLEDQVIAALLTTHPYEEVAYDIYPLGNSHPRAGSGIRGELPLPVEETEFLEILKVTFGIPVIRHSPLLGKKVKRVAVCGGAGAFLLKDALASGSDFFVTGDIKYHQFFDAAGRIVMADIGHFESEQFTKELFYDLLTKKFHTFAVRLPESLTNPVNYHQ